MLKSRHGAGLSDEVCQVESGHALVLFGNIFSTIATFLLPLFLQLVDSKLLLLML